ncbi:MAG: PD40 domain-containing protein, partial [Paludibacteraceae bacterium]|nr:PD40 domain-containing protein [Paludibacteraceae bacterium]
MKRLFLSFLLTFGWLTSQALDPIRYEQIGNLISQGYFDQGIQAIQKEIKKDKTEAAWYWLLDDIYRINNRYTDRLAILDKALKVKKLQQRDETQLRKARALFDSGRYDEAEALLTSLRPTKQVRNAIDKCRFAKDAIAHPLDVSLSPMGDAINSEFDNIWPAISADEQVFSTTVIVGKRGLVRNTQEIQEDLYVSFKKDGQWQPAQALKAPINSRENEGAQSVSADGRYLFYVACNRADSKGSCDIYYIMREGDGWSEPIHPGEPLNTRFWESTPCFAVTGKEIFFASSRDGGIGGQDIWSCPVRMGEDGRLQFGRARNLGDSINTIFDEISPFLHSDAHTLYFSSNGWPGMGQHDIFVSRRDSAGWSKAANIGYPINTHQDEIGFSINAHGDKAYLSADRLEGDEGHRLIYEVNLPEQQRPTGMRILQGKITDAQTGQPLQAIVEVFDSADGHSIFTTVSDKQTGRYTAIFPNGRSTGLHINKTGYLLHSEKRLETPENEEHPIALKPISKGNSMVLENIYFAVDSYEIDFEASKTDLKKMLDLLRFNPQLRI